MPVLKKIFQGQQSDRYVENPAERTFAVAWQIYCRETYLNIFASKTGSHEIEVAEVGKFMRNVLRLEVEPEEIEKTWSVVCTVIQWLGSYGGQLFLRKVRECKTIKKR